MKNISTKYTYIFSFFLLLGITSCDDALDVDLPSNQLSSETVYASEPTAEAAVNGIYQSMVTDFFYNRVHSLLGQTADELVPRTGIANLYSSNEIPETDGTINTNWSELYKTIYNANNVIEGVSKSTSLSAVKSRQWIAEAKFLRAYSYFYLTNLWGNVPLVLTTNVDVSALLPQSSQENVYTQILLDLTDASKDLPTDYKNYDEERIRATKWAAEALLARVNLYLGRWSDAATHATTVINQTSTYKIITDLGDDNSPFITDNDEAILQIPYFNVSYTYEGSSVFTTGGTFLLRKGNSLFETGDARKTNWTVDIRDRAGVFLGIAPHKYQNGFGDSPVERSTVLRLAELYLIRAEARVRSNDITGAQQDINVIRNRALLGNTSLTDTNQLLDLIALERQREFFAENGHRWLDLKRTGKLDETLSVLSDKIWKSTDNLYPIPEPAIRSNPFLTQNSGY
ncbi:RagB/SusD family nutrient uptake outer membrane protein [Flavobacterium chungbukense]|uniref:RagB/SusD family nutrient uptake outer membrane protein n=1 Tax=Flavobacterium chungbukense TaxID=877464 RepID=A0ABP7YMT6_9FLAO|nr:RagB/SusD family nutrient uptake outer membrane protein [Flavobacterium chungbukense]MCC4919886.1 RagB/SusD family nutrient uptake outer membrane protein [Flavobacterium chungbukense]